MTRNSRATIDTLLVFEAISPRDLVRFDTDDELRSVVRRHYIGVQIFNTLTSMGRGMPSTLRTSFDLKRKNRFRVFLATQPPARSGESYVSLL